MDISDMSIENIKGVIKYFADRYWAKDSPEISDIDYDALKQKLNKLSPVEYETLNRELYVLHHWKTGEHGKRIAESRKSSEVQLGRSSDTHESNESLLVGKDISWKDIEGINLKVETFTPIATVEEGKVKAFSMTMPYGLLSVENPSFGVRLQMPVTHRIDFLNLWDAFQVRGVKRNEEVIIVYKPFRLLSSIRPKLHIYVFPKGKQKKIHGPSQGNLRDPVDEWHPE